MALIDTAYDLKDFKLALVLLALGVVCYLARFTSLFLAQELNKIIVIKGQQAVKSVAYHKILLFVIALVCSVAFMSNALQDSLGYITALTIYVAIMYQYGKEALESILATDESKEGFPMHFPFVMMANKSKKAPKVAQGESK